MPSFEQARQSDTPSDPNAKEGLPLRLAQAGASKSSGAAAGMPTGGADYKQTVPGFERPQADFRVERFFALIIDSRQCAERRADNERALDQLLCAIDRETDTALLRRETLLKSNRADEALIEHRVAKAHYEACLVETEDQEMRKIGNLYLNGFGKLDTKINERMKAHPRLMAAADRFAAAQRDPKFLKGQNIVMEMRQSVMPSINLRAVYAQMLSETGRSGKAVSLIVQAKELRNLQRY